MRSDDADAAPIPRDNSAQAVEISQHAGRASEQLRAKGVRP